MGKLFLGHPGGDEIYKCKSCDAPLADKDDIVSKNFTGQTGSAYLFSKVVNVKKAEMKERNLMTGRHLVRDVSCIKCKERLGWMYEYAVNDAERYKEDCVVLEVALIKEEKLLPTIYNNKAD